MKHLKKSIALSLSLALVFIIGCGNNSLNTSKTPASSPATSNTAASSPTAAPVDKKAEAVTLDYLTWNYSGQTKSTDAWIKGMKDKYNITINMQNVPSDNYGTTFKTKYAANDMPDLVLTHGIDRNFYSQGELATVNPDDFVDLSDLPQIADFLPSVIADRKSNSKNKLFYVPVSTNVLGALYNKKLFSDNGITVPKNIDELTAVLEKFKAAGITPMEATLKSLTQVQIIPFIGFGQYINTKDMTIKQKLSDGSMKYSDIKSDLEKVLNIQQDWRDKGYYQKDILGTDVPVGDTQIALGKAGMLITGTWRYTAIKKVDPTAQIGYFALPLNAKGEKTVVPTSADGGLMISAKSKHLDAAKQAMQYYLSPEIQSLVIADLQGIPTDTKVPATDPFLKDVNDAMNAGAIQPDWWGGNGYYFPSGSTFDIRKALQALVGNSIKVDQFISDFDTANAKALKK